MALLSEEALDRAVTVCSYYFHIGGQENQDATYDQDAHHQLASTVAGETMVLLKNKNGLLPLAKNSRWRLSALSPQKPRFQGGGSSHIIRPRWITDGRN